jgi:signal transduction histidine kinase
MKESNRGTGLGLAISTTIVEEFGGTLQIGSLPGQGTTVTMLLPAAAVSDSASEPAAQPYG